MRRRATHATSVARALCTVAASTMSLRRLSRLLIASPVDGQPRTWTLIDFTSPDEHADAFAGQLADAHAASATPYINRAPCDFPTRLLISGRPGDNNLKPVTRSSPLP